LPGSAIGSPDAELLPRLRAHLGVHYVGALPAHVCESTAARVLAGRSAWTENFGGLQHTLGRAYYTHLETDREDDYFEVPSASDAVVERVAPGLQARMLAMMSWALGADVVRREGFCGPGVHVFPAAGHLAEVGGDVHFDIEGLTDEQLRSRAPAFTAVLMLQPPRSGGALRLWDAVHSRSEHPTEADRAAPSADVLYGRGDLVFLDAYRLHQIQPFGGELDRISATAHAVLVGNAWQVWF
jgi:hypothetical protein